MSFVYAFGTDVQDLPVTSGLLAWYDARDVARITFGSGTAVSQWNDKSGSGNHASQGTAASQPAWTENVLKSKPVVRFNDDRLNCGTVILTGTSARTTICVVQASPSAPGFNAILSLSESTTAGEGYDVVTGASTGKLAVLVNSGNRIFNETAESTTNFFVVSILNPTTPNTDNTYGALHQVALTVASTAARAISTGNTGVTRLGQNLANSSTNALVGDLCELVFYNRELSAAEVIAVENYLRGKWII